MQGVVKESSQTEGGKPYITIDRQRYYFGRDVESYPKAGDKIEFEYQEFGEARGRFGKPRAISSWKPVMNGATGKPETGSTISDADILRSVSNVVGNACAAGLIKTPEELEKWFVATHAGFIRVSRGDAALKKLAKALGADPEFDDDLPDSFYEGLPPQRSRSSEPGF